MKLIFTWFGWWDGTHTKEVVIKTINQGNPSMPSWQQFKRTVKELNGKKVKVEVR